ncbi:hypothetical protein [Mongoliibacter ruber]|uniref:ABC-type branched-subunit amino acid transport system substrate-binding protein n=1 Tax=Mongoliibacter ruber TaxID=1750599 RepID=A0A2T0WEL5_9BACT|nr:hypothetical protein [Mongoliibacter ruber]PRY85095.1 hypothetical protein CLW00_1142 [Mongoliibacter ruber]
MKKIGILLPKSSTHPYIGYDFFYGLNAFYAFHGDNNPSFFTSNIGFGIDDDLLYSETEKMFLEKNVDVVVVFAEHPKVDKIFPLASQFRRPILVVNAGAKYPVKWKAAEYVIFLNLGEMLSAKLVAKKGIVQSGIQKGINATNFYDGGYGMADGFYLGQESAGANILFNFISKHLEADFDSRSIIDFLEENQDPILIFSTYTGEILPLFLKAVEGFDPKITLVCSQATIHEIISNELGSKMALPEIIACSSLSPEWPSKGFQPINEYFKTEVKREASPFSYLGWDAGEVLQKLSSLANTGWKECAQKLEQTTITGSRGALRFHLETGYFIGDQYQFKVRGDKYKVIKIEVEEVLKEWEQLMESRPTPPQVGWFNTYLCS